DLEEAADVFGGLDIGSKLPSSGNFLEHDSALCLAKLERHSIQSFFEALLGNSGGLIQELDRRRFVGYQQQALQNLLHFLGLEPGASLHQFLEGGFLIAGALV